MEVKDYAIQCFKDEAAAVLGLTEKLDDKFEQAVELMYDCKGKVIVTGVGKSGHIGARLPLPSPPQALPHSSSTPSTYSTAIWA